MPVPRLRKKEAAERRFGGSWDARPEASALRQSHKLGILHSTQKHQPHTPSESALRSCYATPYFSNPFKGQLRYYLVTKPWLAT